MKSVFIVFFVCLSSILLAQKQSDSQLAYTYYANKEYDKAAEIFLQLYQRTKSSSYLNFHVICLINGKKYNEAETTLKKYLKTDDNNKDFLINLGYIYEQQGKIQKSEEYFNKALKKLQPNNNDIQNLARKFREIREYEWATKTYQKGQTLLNNPKAYILEIGENHMYERNYEAMFQQFVSALEMNPGNLNAITSKLNFARMYDVNNNVDTIIKEQLPLLFKNPQYPPVFDELAIWFALQMGNYPQAFDHGKKLNQKMPGKLDVYLNIAREASRSKQYSTALQAYNEILNAGKENNNFYNTARKEILQCQYAQYETTTDIPELQYKTLATDCQNYLQETGYINTNVDIILLMADVYAYKLNLPDTANTILQKGESIKRLAPNNIYTLKSKRANVLAFMENPWEATILYTQIEKANPNNDIGYEAKLNKARMAYYEGDLLWAKAQFDVLKGSTSKLISNDAIKMSHFINTNYEEDDENQDLSRIAQTEYLIYRQQYMQSLPILDSLINQAQSGIADYAALLKTDILLRQNQPEQARQLLENLSENSEQTYIQAEALFKLAQLKKDAREYRQALALYKKLVSDYSGSIYSIEAGKIYRELEKNIKD
ncbi:tetratricopeptide repeat protein [Odoribacter lunatus]|uniref:tetratricopeptide repeat protein n=1 Tax=Odoribacter lunatus TaxID=2941335 RepID=UPI00203A7BD5|nr:tetratricopeptide repeat protein [Odoribacter lunatus]